MESSVASPLVHVTSLFAQHHLHANKRMLQRLARQVGDEVCVRRCCIVARNISTTSPMHRSQRPFGPAIGATPLKPKQHGSWLDLLHRPQF